MIKIGKFSCSLTALSAAVVALCSAGIIGLSVYAYSKEDYLATGKEQIHILINSWSSLERETTNLLIDSTAAGDNKKWLYSLTTFDKRLKGFLNSSLTQELAARNRFFDHKASGIAAMWPMLKEKIEKSVLEMAGYVESHKGVDLGHNGGLLYQIGYLSASENQAAQAAELSRIINDCRHIMSNSRIRCTVILEEMNDIISDQIRDQTADLRLIVFMLSMGIVVSMIFFIIQTQRENHLYQRQLEKLVDSTTSELDAEKMKTEAARIQTDQINRQLVATISRANVLSQQAIEANNAKNEFMASVSHEIRTPMNAVMGFSEMLAEDNLTPTQKKHVGIIRESSKHLLELINDILDFSKIEAGKMSVEFIECSVEDILAAVESMMRPMVIEQELEFNIIRNDPIADTIHTDPARLKQCLINLIGNAIKFTEKGYVRLNISCQQQNDKGFIKFDVEDSGIGIAPDKVEHIFEPFAQADISTSRIYGGTGLGLAITRNLAELLGGDVTVRSVKGKGSVFSLSVPTGVESGQTSQTSALGDKKENSRSSLPDLNNVKLSGKILVAEDSPTNQTLIELLLKRMGLESVVVENGQLAVERAASGEFDLILMDIQMPMMNGFEATRQLRKDGIKTPIVALTACAMKGDDRKCLAAGCSDYLTKPVDRKKLAQILAKYLSVNDVEKTLTTISAAKEDSPQKTSQVVLPLGDGSEIEIDFHLLLERIGDESLIDEIIPVFLRDNTERLEMLSQAVAKNDVKEIKFYAHSIKGASATIGATKISELAKQLETIARDGQGTDCKTIFEEIRMRFNRLREFLSRSDWKQAAEKHNTHGV